MALTVSESHDVNTLLDWLLGIRNPYTIGSDEELMSEAKASAMRLADKANKTLMAGLTGVRVEDAWQRVEACPWQDGNS